MNILDGSGCEISSEQISLLNEFIADPNNAMASEARALLDMVEGNQTIGTIVFPSEQSSRKSNLGNTFIVPDPLIKCFPNPADEYFTIEYKFPFETLNKAQIEIYSADGKIVKTIDIDKQQNQIIINTKDLLPGIYVCSLKNMGIVVESTTISLIRK